MKRLIVVVEGQTEDEFVRNVLRPHLGVFGVFASSTIVGKVIAQKRGHSHRGGGDFSVWRRDIEHLLRSDTSTRLHVTTLFDLYGLPENFPEKERAGLERDTSRRCEILESALWQVFSDHRFLRTSSGTEFEALVLASVASLGDLFDAADDMEGICALERDIANLPPEDINDGKQTAPSKRLEAYIPSYRKTLHGPLAIEFVGLDRIRKLCPRFGVWLHFLEQLAQETTE